jgi:hypothetical protein
MSRYSIMTEAIRSSAQESSDVNRSLELVQDLIVTLTAKQKDLVIGLGRGSAATITTLHARIPVGTRELLESHEVIDGAGNLTELGALLADQLAFEAREGPDPRLVARALASEAKLLST